MTRDRFWRIVRRYWLVIVCVGLIAVAPMVRPARPAPGDEQTRDQTGGYPQRIISLVPAVTEMLFAIGGDDRVVAVSSFDHYPPAVELKPRVGALVDPDFERIIALRPDLVVVYGTQSDLIQRLQRLQIPIFSYENTDIAELTKTIATLGERIGRVREAASEVDRITRGIDEVTSLVAGAPRPKTALLFGRDLGTLRGIFASGGVGFMHDVLIAAGADDVFADVTRQSLQVSTETLLARAPETIVEAYPKGDWTPALIASETLVWRGLPTLPAVRNGRVYILADDALVVPGPRIVTAVRLMAHALHPDRVK